ncbi:MAG: ATP-binding cassette domain-containing protein [Bacillota bacterium]|nr:ATP-binding cassette domain-containing protein [Bacillota bacterium]
MIKTPAIKKEYDGRVVLDVPSLEFEEGKVYALIGANGSGKTTFGKECGLSYQPQKPYAFRMTVLENVMLTGVSAETALKLLGQLEMTGFAKARADKLSGGETAKMALARSIAANSTAIVFDEPTNSMDMSGSILAEKLIRQYADEGHIVILITHSMRQAKRIADEIIFLKDGKINNNENDLKEFMEYYA